MRSTAFLVGYYGLRLDSSPDYVAGYISVRLDAPGEGVACGKSWISRRKKCSKTKSATTPRENLDKTIQKQKDRQALRGLVERSKGLKPYVKAKAVGPAKPPHKNPQTPQEYIENGRAIAAEFLEQSKGMKAQIDSLTQAKQRDENELRQAQRAVMSKAVDEARQDPEVRASADKAKPFSAEMRSLNDRLYLKQISYEEYTPQFKSAQKRVKKIKAETADLVLQKAEALVAKDPKVKAAQRKVDSSQRLLDQVSEPARKFKANLLASSSVSRSDAEVIAKKVKKPSGYKTKDPELPNQIADFMQLTNGKGSTSLNRITITSQRAHSTQDGLVRYHGKGSHDVLFHEIGHQAEYTNPQGKQAARQWIEERATGPAKSLRTLTGNRGYGRSEVAYPDKFVNPYVGKVYKGGITEVLAVGLEHFASPEKMVRLATEDPDHFALTLGIVRQ